MKRLSRPLAAMSFAWCFVFAAPLPAESLDREFLAAARDGDIGAAIGLLEKGADPNFRRMTNTTELPQTTALREAVVGRNAEIVAAILARRPNDRVLKDAISSLPDDEGEAKSGLGLLFVETLLKQGRFPWLSGNAGSIRAEVPLKRILQAGQIDSAAAVEKALQSWNWDTVKAVAAGLRTVDPAAHPGGEPVTRGNERSCLPYNLVARASERPHEETKAAELWRLFESRGIGTGKWGDIATRAAAGARSTGLVVLAEAMDPGGKAEKTASITDEDRLASAWFYGDEAAVETYRKAGVRLRGTAGLHGYGNRRTLAARLLANKDFDRIGKSGIDLADWTDPQDDPYRLATDLETVRWLLDRKIPFDRDPELLLRILVPLTAKKIPMAEVLIDAGADAKATGGFLKWTPLHAVVLTQDGDREEAIRMLLRKGADPDQPDGAGKSAVQQAADTYQVRMLKLLDPDRKSPFWKKYDSPMRKPYAGAWSNDASGFDIVTLMLREDGDGLLNAGGVGGGLAFLRFEGKRAMLDLVSPEMTANGIYIAKVSETAKVEHPGNDKRRLRLVLGENTFELKRAASAAELEDSLKKAETADYRPHYGPPKKRGGDELLERGLKIIRVGAGGHQLDLLEWPLEELPEDFSSSTLRFLSISGGKLRKLPDDLARRFPNMESLKVENVPLKECPVGLDQLPNLTDLRLIDTGLSELPDVRLEHITYLNVSGNRLANVPDGWFASKTIGGCCLSNNRLEQLPAGLAKCHALQSLDVSANGMKRFDAGKWPDLVRLSLDENRMTELPPEIHLFHKMKYLHLAGNHVTKLPDSMAAMTELEQLRLSFNDLKRIPEFLAVLPHLRYAGLDGNLIPQNELKAFETRKRQPQPEAK